jgi:hypothetical protein
MWRLMYVNYQVKCLDFIFVKKASKDHLCDTLKESKTRNYNVEGLEMTTLQNVGMFQSYKWICFKKCFKEMP